MRRDLFVERIARAHTKAIALDKTLSLAIYEQLGPLFPRSLYLLLEHLGNGILWIILSVFGICYGASDQSTRSFFAKLLVGLFIDVGLIGSAKFVFQRPRPVYNNAKDFQLFVSVDKFSFPSGHSSRVGFLASYFIISYAAQVVPLTLALCLWAVTTAVSRVTMGRHYLGDISVGLCLGFVTTMVILKVCQNDIVIAMPKSFFAENRGKTNDLRSAWRVLNESSSRPALHCRPDWRFWQFLIALAPAMAVISVVKFNEDKLEGVKATLLKNAEERPIRNSINICQDYVKQLQLEEELKELKQKVTILEEKAKS